MRKFLWIGAVFLMLLCTFNGETTSGNADCQNPKKLCDIDAEKCLRKPHEDDETIGPCGSMQYSSLYQDRSEKWPFQISSVSLKYQNWTFAVIEIVRGISSKAVENCCNLRINETCQLRPKQKLQEKNYFQIYGTNGKEFCYNLLQEYPTKNLKWCSEVGSDVDNCLDLYDGIIVIKEKYYRANLESFAKEVLRMEYCFFEVHEQNVHGNETGGLVQISSGSGLFNSSEVAIEGQENTECRSQSKVNLIEYCSNNKPKEGHFLCFSARAKNTDLLLQGYCQKYSLGKEENIFRPLTVLIATGSIFLLLFILFFFCRAMRRKYYPSYEDTIKNNKSVIDEAGNLPFHDNNEGSVMNEKTHKLIIDGISDTFEGTNSVNSSKTPLTNGGCEYLSEASSFHERDDSGCEVDNAMGVLYIPKEEKTTGEGTLGFNCADGEAYQEKNQLSNIALKSSKSSGINFNESSGYANKEEMRRMANQRKDSEPDITTPEREQKPMGCEILCRSSSSCSVTTSDEGCSALKLLRDNTLEIGEYMKKTLPTGDGSGKIFKQYAPKLTA